MNKISIIFLIAIFSSIVLNPLFIKNGIPEGITLFSKAFGDESDGDSGDSSDQKDDSSDDGAGSGDDQTTDDQTTDDQTTNDQTTNDQTTNDQTTDDKCDKKETADETTNDETTDEKCDTKEISDETNNDNKDGRSNSDEKESVNDNKVPNDKKDIQSSDSDTGGNEYTLLDKITSDPTILESVINDKKTDTGLVSNLVQLKQETETASISETCDNNEMIATVSDEDCASTITTNDIIDSGTNTDTNFTNISTNIDTNTNTTDSSTNANTTTPTSGNCDEGADNSTDSIIASTNNENCTPTTPEPVSDTCSNGVDNNTTGTSNGTSMDCIPPISNACDDTEDNNTTDAINCPVKPNVAIDSAVDEAGNSLSQGDLIIPQKVTFTFSANASEATQALEGGSAKDYQFECSVDDESFKACSSPMTYAMETGKHNFVVRLVP